MTIKTKVYVLRTHDDFGVGYAVAAALHVTNIHSSIIQARMFDKREAAEYFLSLQSENYRNTLSVVEFAATFTERS